MTESILAAELSPLDQIRLAEAEISRKTVAARKDSERCLAEARTQAAWIKKQARKEGTHAGKVKYKEIISKAEDEARAITAHAQNQAATLLQEGRSRMEIAIEVAVSIVLGLEKNGRNNEP